MSALPAAANSGQYLATGASGSSPARSIRMARHSEVIALVVDQTLVSVSALPGPGPGRVGPARPQVDYRLAAGHDRDARADLAALGEVRRERVPHRLKAGLAVPLIRTPPGSRVCVPVLSLLSMRPPPGPASRLTRVGGARRRSPAAWWARRH